MSTVRLAHWYQVKILIPFLSFLFTQKSVSKANTRNCVIMRSLNRLTAVWLRSKRHAPLKGELALYKLLEELDNKNVYLLDFFNFNIQSGISLPELFITFAMLREKRQSLESETLTLELR